MEKCEIYSLFTQTSEMEKEEGICLPLHSAFSPD